ncbi:MAG: cytochrome P450 [Candidatus Azotimanducaceae bacterium]|jgi:cytochrome P450|tara:strand:+ start:1473 stop:2708 length:1236 start_codon:yes stop_codon:yes gene_type:complete
MQAEHGNPYDIDIDAIDVSQPEYFQNDTIDLYFQRLRNERPIHYCAESRFGPYWSITKFDDIMAVEKDHQNFSSNAFLGGIQLTDFPKGMERANFINMDPPEHDAQRKIVSPIVAPSNLASMEGTIREHVIDILDQLPNGEVIDWVDKVSIELTTRMLATLFDFPFEERRKLTYWSEVASADLATSDKIKTEEQRIAALGECLTTFKQLMTERANLPPKNDLVSMLAHSPMVNMDDQQFLSTLILLIIGGNDTTRNSISGGLLALMQNPEEFAKLRANPSLVNSLVPEVIRWQTPLTHMRRTTTKAVEIGGVAIPAGAKVVMWYLSGNRDEQVIDKADQFIVDRKNPRHHLSFGFGIHRCVGNRLAEMQIRVLWEEILSRNMAFELAGEAERTHSNVIHGITTMPVRVTRP